MKETRSYVIKKGAAEKYMVRRDGWVATIYLDEDTGEVSVAQGYQDNYAYCWSAPGRGKETLKEFLVTANASYVMDKFSYGMDKWLDYDKSLDQLNAELKQKLEDGVITKSQMEAIEIEIEENLGDDFDNTNHWYDCLYRCEELMEAYGHDPHSLPCVTDVKPQLRGFMERVWPVFIEQLKRELDRKSTRLNSSH